MAYGYKSGDRQQGFLLPPSMDEWLDEDHLAYFVIDTVKLIDTTAFHKIHPEGPGRPAYEPEMMLGLLLYAYATGVRSSRRIMAACRSDLAYKVIAVNLVPDHRTIARFRADNEEAIRSVFVEVLKLCDAAGLASLGQIAIDGTKIGSDAALDQNRSKEWICTEINKILGEAEAADTSEEVKKLRLRSSRPSCPSVWVAATAAWSAFGLPWHRSRRKNKRSATRRTRRLRVRDKRLPVDASFLVANRATLTQRSCVPKPTS
jgi:transposase